MKCKMCDSEKLELFLDLGFVALVDRFLSFEELNESETLYPLNVCICHNCGLVQLGYVVPAEKLFNENYAYESGTTQKRQKSYDDFANYITTQFRLPKESLVIDIGSNAGVLLSCFKERGMRVLGIDPSTNIVKIANEKGIETLDGFFDDEMVTKILSKKIKPKVVTATNAFAHVQDYNAFTKSLIRLMDDESIFVFQVPHFLHLIENLEYDTIYHEHLSYFGLKPLKKFFEKFDMEIFEILETDLDGGSIRCFVGKKNKWPISPNLKKISEKEEEKQIYSIERLKKFAKDAQNQKNALLKLLVELKSDGKKVVGVSAPAKGMTLLNFCKIDDNLIEYLTEKSILKIGKFSPGMHIRVEPDSKILDEQPDYALILAWNFADEIMKNLQKFKDGGGKFIIPIPYPKII